MPSRQLRVLQICGSLTPMPCGIGDYTAHLAEALGKMEAVTTGVLTSRAASIVAERPFEALPIIEDWRPSALPRILGAVQRWKPDLVHMQFPAQGYGHSYGPWLIPAALTLLRYPVVQTWHEYYPAGSGWRNILNALAPGGLIVVRPNYLEQMPSWYRRIVARKHFRLIPNAAALPAVSLTEKERLALREKLEVGDRSLVVYFGFVYPAKGTHAVFDIASAAHDRLVLVGQLDEDNPYHERIMRRIASDEWRGHALTTGFLPERDAAAILAAADAVVLPFTEGSGFWNTTVRASAKQGTFVLTTSSTSLGYDAAANIYSAAPGAVDEMRQALREYIGRRVDRPSDDGATEWRHIAEAHLQVYRQVLGTTA